MATLKDDYPPLLGLKNMARLLQTTADGLAHRRGKGLVLEPTGGTTRVPFWDRDEVEDWIEARMPPAKEWAERKRLAAARR